MTQRNIRLNAKRRKQPDYRKLSRALIAFAAAQAEADAAAGHLAARPTAPKETGKRHAS